MLRNVSLSELLTIVNAQAEVAGKNEILITGVSTDSRTIASGDLYIPLKGERFNGHRFITAAREAGAVAALIDEDVELCSDERFPLIRVSDCLLALGQVAAFQRDQLTGPVVAVTGSAGKTSVKQLMANVLSQKFNTWMTQGNLNNHIGVPLTLLALEHQHQAAVIELGASGLNEIAYSAQFVTPKVGIITNASEAHLEGFGSLAGIVKTKGELIDFVTDDGVVVLNKDDDFFSDWLTRAGDKKVVTFGLCSDADVTANNIRSDLDGSRFILAIGNSRAEVHLPLLGEHNVRNALAVVAAASVLGLTITDIVTGLHTAEAYKGRLQWCAGAKQQRILDDSYNASPASVYAAIDVLANAASSWLVLGDMAELGGETEKTHRQVGEYAQNKGITHLVATGEHNKNSVAAFGNNGVWFENRDDLVHFLQQQTQANDVLLVKGSRSAGMDKVVSALQTGQGEV